MSYEAWGDGDEFDDGYRKVEDLLDAGWLDPENLSKAMLDVVNERDRQVNEEHFDEAGDDGYVLGELAKAAASYSTYAGVVAQLRLGRLNDAEIAALAADAGVPPSWPWAPEWWKPVDQRRSLVKAAALLVAEIERLDRAEKAKAG